MSLYRLSKSPYFVSDVNNPGETGPWKNQKKSSKGKTNSVYRKNWTAFLASQEPKPKEVAGQKVLRRVTKDGQIIQITPQSIDQNQKEHLVSILKTD